MSYLLKSRKTSSSRPIKIKWDFISRQNRVTRTDQSTRNKNKIKQKDKLYETLASRPWIEWAPWFEGVELGTGGGWGWGGGVPGCWSLQGRGPRGELHRGTPKDCRALPPVFRWALTTDQHMCEDTASGWEKTFLNNACSQHSKWQPHHSPIVSTN